MRSVTAPQRRRNADDAFLSEQTDEVLRASRALVGIAAASLAGLEESVTLPQFRVLVMVYTRGPLNLAAVAAGLDVNPSNASRTCDRLIKAGLLHRRESATDRRNIVLTLTPTGRRLIDKVNRRRRKAIERALRKMAPAERAAVAEAMSALATAAGEPADTAGVLAMVWPPTS
jgi:DNA-binding MarR family transcriptional regulator